MTEMKDKKMNKSAMMDKEKMDQNKTAPKSKEVCEKSYLKTNEKVVKKGKDLFSKTEKKKETKQEKLNEEQKEEKIEIKKIKSEENSISLLKLK